MPVAMPSKDILSKYELRLLVSRDADWQLEIFQIPSAATPRLTAPEYLTTLKGTALRLLENRVLKRLARAKIQLGQFWPGKHRSWPVDEETALQLGLLFRVLAPMRNLDRIRQVYLPQSFLQIFCMQGLYLLQVSLQGFDQGLWQWGHPVFLAFLIPNNNLPVTEVQVLGPQPQALHETQSGPV